MTAISGKQQREEGTVPQGKIERILRKRGVRMLSRQEPCGPPTVGKAHGCSVDREAFIMRWGYHLVHLPRSSVSLYFCRKISGCS